MNQKLYRIQIASLRAALGHLQLLDLRELADCAVVHGTDDDKVLLAALRVALATLPPGHR
jgi:hypothetical protein